MYKFFFLFAIIFKFFFKKINWQKIFKEKNIKIYDIIIQINNPLSDNPEKNVLYPNAL